MTASPMSARGTEGAWTVITGLVACVVACAGGDPGEGDAADVDSTSTHDSGVDLAAPSDVEALCPGGCTAFDGPCMRGLCGAFGCYQERISRLACDDDLVCTTGDRCELGMCRGEVSTCEPGVPCGEVFCPGADALCIEGHCVACSMVIEDADCESPRYPRLACPNMPAGRRVVARLSGRVPTTGFVYFIRVALSWADSTWGDPATGFCEVLFNRDGSLPEGCGTKFTNESIGFEPRLMIERLTFVDEAVAAFVATTTDIDGPVCDGTRLGGAVLSIEALP